MARRGGFPGGMPGNMNNIMKQAQKMQKQMEEAQAQLEESSYTATSGGGAVEVTISGKKEITSIKFDPEVVDPDDIEMLEDLTMAAVNEAIRKIEEVSAQKMSKITVEWVVYSNGLLQWLHYKVNRRAFSIAGSWSQNSRKACIPHIRHA